MRKNHPRKSNNPLSAYDHVYIDIPQCNWISDIVVDPIKAVYHNRAAAPGANVVHLIRDVDELDAFMFRFGVELF